MAGPPKPEHPEGELSRALVSISTDELLSELYRRGNGKLRFPSTTCPSCKKYSLCCGEDMWVGRVCCSGCKLPVELCSCSGTARKAARAYSKKVYPTRLQQKLIIREWFSDDVPSKDEMVLWVLDRFGLHLTMEALDDILIGPQRTVVGVFIPEARRRRA